MLCSAWLTLVASGKTASHYNSSSQSSCGSIFITFVTALLWTRSHQHRGKKRDAKFPASKSWTHKCLEAKKIPRDDWVLLRLQVPAGRHYSSWQLFEYLKGENRNEEAMSVLFLFKPFRFTICTYVNCDISRYRKFEFSICLSQRSEVIPSVQTPLTQLIKNWQRWILTYISKFVYLSIT